MILYIHFIYMYINEVHWSYKYQLFSDSELSAEDNSDRLMTIVSPGEVFHKNISKGFYGSYIVICNDSSTCAFEDPLLIKPA